MRILLVFLIFFSSFFHLKAQESTSPDTTTLYQKDAVNIYIDCPGFDLNHIKENIRFVNYVRDRKEAYVHIMVNNQATGSGGYEYSVFFIGQFQFSGTNDTLKFNTEPTSTEEETRAQLLNVLKLGLIRYIAKTPQASFISIQYNGNNEGAGENVKDKWDNWVFSFNLGGWFQGEDSYKYSNAWGSVSARRITPDWKLIFSLSESYNESYYKIDDTTSYISSNNSNSFRNVTVKSLNDHFSAGGSISLNTSTYNNYKFKASLAPALEYNLFKYSESTRKQLRFLYTIGVNQAYYNDTTIFNKTEELLFMQDLSVAFQYIEKWGTISLSVSGSNYLHDFSKNSIDIYSSCSMRIFKGLSLSFSAGYSFVRNQLSLSKEGVSSEEILLRIRALQTSYSYWASVSLSYTFGSIYNNVVNPRFG